MAAGSIAGAERAQRRRVRRSALLWGCVAAAFYIGCIIMMVVRGTK